MQRRRGKKTDQCNADGAFKIIKSVMQEHDEIEPTLWASALWSALVDGYIHSGFSYEDFTNEWNLLSNHYKSWFDERDNCNSSKKF